jgi:hypothetical protein
MGSDPRHGGRTRLLGIILAYAFTFTGVLIGGRWLVSTSKPWTFVVTALIVLIPLFPAVQAVLMGQVDRNFISFLKTYAAEYASLLAQLAFLLATAPFIAIMVAGHLVVVLLITSGIAWILVGLQQLGVKIGRGMNGEDLRILALVTVGLAVGTGLYWLMGRFLKAREDKYFDFWARQFIRIRDIFLT